jgi:hypothetical protein
MRFEAENNHMKTQKTVLLVSSSTLAAGMAHGQLVTSGPLDLTQYYSASSYRQGVSITGGMNDFTFGYEAFANKPYIDARTYVGTDVPAQSGLVNILAYANNGLPVAPAGTLINASYAASLNVVTPASGGRAYFFDDGNSGNQTGDWGNTATMDGFVGIELNLPGGMSYGYLEIIDNPTAQSMTLVDWAYQATPGAGITTASAVPEPSTLELAGAGAAALGLLFKRRKN